MKFGKYEILGRIGRGGMADVLLAEMHGASGFSKKVVLKLLLPHLALDPDFLTMFIDEARLVASLTHPSIVQTHDLGEAAGRHYIEMDYVPGGTLGELAKGALPIGAVIALLHPVLNALHYAHARGVVHRDVSPHNILLSRDGLVKVSDFGIAKGAHSRARTRTGAIKGKFSYMSPEQAQGKPASGKSDVYAAGIIAYELLTGTRLFHAEQELDILRLVRKPNVAPHAQVPASVMRALAADPADRFPDADAFARALLAEATPWSETELRDFVSAQKPEDALEPVEEDEIVLEPGTGTGLLRNPGTQESDSRTNATSGVATQPGSVAPANFLGSWVPKRIFPVFVLLVAAFYLWPRPVPPPAEVPATVAVLPAPAPPAPAPAPVGYITVNARPWAAVSIDGQLVAKETPLVRHRVPPGVHHVELKRQDGLRSAFDVDVQAGETVSKFEDWAKYPPRR